MKSWEITEAEQLTKSIQRNIPYYITSRGKKSLKKNVWKNDYMYNQYYYFFFSSSILVFVNSFYLDTQILLHCFFLILSPSHWEAGVSEPLCGAELPAELNHNNDLSVSRMKDKYSLIHRSISQQQAVSSAWSSSAFVFVFNEETCSVAHSQSENNKGIAAMSRTIKKIKTLLVLFAEKQEQLDVWPPTCLCKL